MTALAPRDAYRLWAPTYATETAISFIEDELARELSPPLAGRRLLDAGCGTGRRLLGANASFAAGIDASPEMLLSGHADRVAAADLCALPFAAGSFDVVWCRLVLGHLQDLQGAYDELARVCASGGDLLVSDFHAAAAAAGHKRSFRDSGGVVHEVEHHIYDGPTHISAAARSGFILLRMRDGTIGPSVEHFYTRAGRHEVFDESRPARRGQLLLQAAIGSMRILIEAANTTIAVDDGRIVEVSGSFEHVVRAPKGEVRPGLINAHEHLHRNHYGRLGAPPYANAYEWARDIQSRNRIEIARGREMPRREALLFGAWKNLIAGVTHVFHHDTWEPVFEIGYPLHVIKLPTADSLGMTPALPLPPGGPFAMHVAEGTDAAAAEEIRELDRRGFLTSDFMAVHAVGADQDGVIALRRSGCAVIWCPSSNRFLFGRAAPAALLAEGTDVLLGTDSLLTGDGTILDEMQVARRDMSDSRILDAVGPLAARRLGVARTPFAVGARADIVVSGCPMLQSRTEDVMLVMANGILRVLEPELAAAMRPSGGRTFEGFGVRRWINDSPA